MRLRFESKEEVFDLYPVGDSIIRVHKSSGEEHDFSFGGQKDWENLDSILPGPVWTGKDRQGNGFRFLSLGKKFFLHYKGFTYVSEQAPRVFEDAGNLSREVRSPMPGKILKVCKIEGESFQKGETLLILEAMKMENQIKAGFEGKVGRVLHREGALVGQDDILMELES